MKRSNLNFLVDTVAFVTFLFMVVTGVIMEFVLPAGSGHATTIWGLDRHGWGDIHFWFSVVFLASLAIHVYLHWKWIVSVLRGRPREGSGVRLGLGAVGLVALLMIAAAPLLSPVERSATLRTGAEPRSGFSEGVDGGEGFRAGVALAHDEHAEGQHSGESGTSQAGMAEVRGSTTLGEVVDLGVPIEALQRELHLPPGTPSDERLGRLARTYGFTLGQVRELVDAQR